MAVRFKFRSSVNFDSVDIDGRPSISVGDLKSRILRNKNINICQDFDLVFSDAVTGQEYCDEKFQIPSGSSVIIKRVPAGSKHSGMAPVESFQSFGGKDQNVVKPAPAKNIETDSFDDFGVELCPVPEATICSSDVDMDKKFYFTSEKKNNEVPRCFEKALVGCQKHEASDLNQVIAKGASHIGDTENMLQEKLNNITGNTNLAKVVTANPQARQTADLPSELKCSLCDMFFVEAVMIPCCQHSFCETCICRVLAEKAKCPKCSSTKCRVEDLLPNVSLRQAIERFLQSQFLIKRSENAYDQYAPDGESGIQAKEISHAVTIHQREAEVPHSPSATGRGSNQVIEEPIGGKSAILTSKLKQVDEERHGENQPVHDEAESTVKKKSTPWINCADRSSVGIGRPGMGDRACYICGSPDHFMRDCPEASCPRPMLHSGNAIFPGAMPGYMPPYWNGTPFHQMRPFINPYNNPGMIPFNVTMVPPTSFAIPTYIPSVFDGIAAYGGFTRMGAAGALVGTRAQWHLGCPDGMELQGHEKRQKLSKQNMRRGHCIEANGDYSFSKRHHDNEAERSHDRQCLRDREECVSYSDDSSTHKSCRKKRQFDHCDHDQERSSLAVEDWTSSSILHGEEPRKRHHRNLKMHDGRTKWSGSDSSRSHPRSNENKDKRKKVRSDTKRGRHRHSESDSPLQPSLSSDTRRSLQKDRDSRIGSKHSRQSLRSTNDDPLHERWQMASGVSDEYGEEDYHYYNLKSDYKKNRQD